MFLRVDVPPGHVAILPGYTLERATCGLIKAAVHQVVRPSWCATAPLPLQSSQPQMRASGLLLCTPSCIQVLPVSLCNHCPGHHTHCSKNSTGLQAQSMPICCVEPIPSVAKYFQDTCRAQVSTFACYSSAKAVANIAPSVQQFLQQQQQ